MTVQQTVPLFTDEELAAGKIEPVLEDLIASLIGEGFVSLKKEVIMEAIIFHGSSQQRSSLQDIKRNIEHKAKTLEYPQVYEPIIQIEAFEKSRIPLFFKEDGEIESVIGKVFMYFFPGCEIKKTDTHFELHLNSVPFRRYSYFSNLVKENSSWVGFVSDKFKDEYEINNRGQRLLEGLENTFNQSNILTYAKKRIEFDQTAFNYDEVILSLPYKSETYMNAFSERNGNRSNAFFSILDKLVRFSYHMHFVSDSYREINTAVNEEFEKEKEVYTEKQQKAVVEFEKELKHHIVPISQLNHKSAEAFAKANGIEEVLMPITNTQRLTTNAEVGLSVYVREDDKKNQEWLIVPPTQEVLEFTGMEYQGVLNYVNYETTSYLATKQNSPHVVGKDSQLNTMIDEKLFLDVLVENYKESPSYPAIAASVLLLQNFPKAFAKVGDSPEREVAREATPGDFSDFLSGAEPTSEPKEAETGTLTQALASLNTHIDDGPASEKQLIEVDSLIKVVWPEDKPLVGNMDAVVVDGLLQVNEINLVEREGKHKVLLSTNLFASDVEEYQERNTVIDLSEVSVVFPNAEALRMYYNASKFNSTEYDSIDFELKLEHFARKMNLPFEFHSEEQVDEEFEVVEDTEEDDVTFELSEIFDDEELPSNLPESLNRVASDFIYALNMSNDTFYVFHNKNLIHEHTMSGGVTTPRLEQEIARFRRGKTVEETGITSDGLFLLPIYNHATGSVITAVAVH